jgi:DNA-binding NarL/FixJ family response regulator
MLVHRSTLLDALAGYFDLIWSQAVPLTLEPGRAAANGSPLSPEDQTLLAMLLAGLTDQAIAARLGLGHRSVQRRVRALMDLAGVETRVQLGWHAHRNAWLGHPDGVSAT